VKEINDALRKQKMSIRQLAIKAGLPYTNVYDLLHNKRLPRSGEIKKIRDVLGIETKD
jgi:lambda repressor-like predicted transcriptional regulator